MITLSRADGVYVLTLLFALLVSVTEYSMAPADARRFVRVVMGIVSMGIVLAMFGRVLIAVLAGSL